MAQMSSSWSDHPSNWFMLTKKRQVMTNSWYGREGAICAFVIEQQWRTHERGQSGGSRRRQFESFLCVSRNCVTSRIMTTSPPPWSVSLSGNPKICSNHQIRGGTCLYQSGSQMELSVFSCEPNYQTSSNLRMHITLGHPVHLHTSTHS